MARVLAAAVVALALYPEVRDQLREIELGPTGLALRTVLRERALRRDDIDRAELVLKHTGHVQLLSVGALLKDGNAVWVHPAGTDAQELHDAVKSWLETRG